LDSLLAGVVTVMIYHSGANFTGDDYLTGGDLTWAILLSLSLIFWGSKQDYDEKMLSSTLALLLSACAFLGENMRTISFSFSFPCQTGLNWNSVTVSRLETCLHLYYS